MILILHGWTIDPNTHQKWQAFRDFLTKKKVKSEILGIPGLSAPLNEVWNLEKYVNWLDGEVESARKKGNKEIILLGHSFGGQIAAKYASMYPQKVQKLILIDSSGIRDHSVKATVKRRGFFVAAKFGKLFFQSEKMRQLLYKLARERDYQQAPPLLRRTMSTILEDEVVADLPNISCPTLIVWGAEDKVTPLFLGRIFQAKIPHNEFQIIADARHSPQYTHPEVVADLIEKFLQQKPEGEK